MRKYHQIDVYIYQCGIDISFGSIEKKEGIKMNHDYEPSVFETLRFK